MVGDIAMLKSPSSILNDESTEDGSPLVSIIDCCYQIFEMRIIRFHDVYAR